MMIMENNLTLQKFTLVYSFATLIFCFSFIVCSPNFRSLKNEAEQNFDWQVELRRYLHQHPELGFEEFETSKRIQEELKSLNVKFTSGWGKRTLTNGTVVGGTGIVAEIGTGAEPCIGLRADMDALPIMEKADLPFKSLNDGRMHACGHDGHVSMLMGAVKLLKAREASLKGTVRFVFQPAEEGGGGAADMVAEGALSRSPAVESIFGLHMMPEHPTGWLGSRAGTFEAASQRFQIRVNGFGGHAAMPHRAKDPIAVAVLIVQAFNNIVSRFSSPVFHDHAVIVTVTTITTPESYNVIPSFANIKGTIRTLTVDKMNFIKTRVQAVAESIASAFEQTASVFFEPVSYPPTVNDPKLYSWVVKTLENNIEINEAPPVMGAEDFSYYGQKVPAVFMKIGTGSGTNPPTNFSLHSAEFILDEKVLPIGSSVFSFLAMERIKFLSNLRNVRPHTEEDLENEELNSAVEHST